MSKSKGKKGEPEKITEYMSKPNTDGRHSGPFAPVLGEEPSKAMKEADEGLAITMAATQIIGNITHRLCTSCKQTLPNSHMLRRKNKFQETCIACHSKLQAMQLKDKAWGRKETAKLEKAAEVQSKRNHRVREERRIEILARKRATEKRRAKKKIADGIRQDDHVSREILSRVLARRKLLHFIRKFKPDYEAGWVHEDICNRLERFFKAVENQESPRLILAMPPRHGKSEIASKNFPAWILGHRPEFEIIASSYNVSLPMGFSRKVKDTIQSPLYKGLFPKTALSKTSQAAEAWLTTKGGGYVAAGVGGGITGKGAHIFIIDDPVKDAEEADSETMREKTWDWWGSTAKTRLAPGGGVLVIQTRWHDDDLSGRMIAQMKEQKEELNGLITEAQERLAAATSNELTAQNIRGEIASYEVELGAIDNWEVVSYPAIATDDEYVRSADNVIVQGADIMEDTIDPKVHKKLRVKGEPLHEARFPAARLINMKRSMQPRHWSALYQQNPVPDEGVYFRKEMFRMEPYIAVGHKYDVYIAWDLAIGEKQTNDYTVGAVIGVDHLGQMHVLDIVRGRWDALGIAEAILNTAQRYKPQVIGIERGQLEMALKPILQAEMKKRGEYYTFAEGADALVPINDKSMRARPLQARMQQGMVFFPSNQPWVEQTIFELMRFPGGVHDDIVDALAWVVRVAMKHSPPRLAKQKEVGSWRDKLKNHIAGSGKKTPMAS